MTVTRRRLLSTAGLGSLALAGCLGSRDPEDETEPHPDTDEESDPPETLPWDADSLAVGIEIHEDVAGHPPDDVDGSIQGALTDAVDFWNGYLQAETPYELELRVSEQRDEDDIRLRFVNHPDGREDDCAQYPLIGHQEDDLKNLACVRTIEEHPEETPVTALIGRCTGGLAVFTLVTTHVIGRLIGIEALTEPTEVMDLRYLSGYGSPPTLLSGLSSEYRFNYVELYEELSERNLPRLESDQQYDSMSATDLHETLSGSLTLAEEALQRDLENIRDHEAELYAEAIETVLLEGEEFTNIETTESLAAELAQEDPDIDLRDDDRYDELLDAVQTVVAGQDRYEPFDLRVHRYWADEMWEAHMSE